MTELILALDTPDAKTALDILDQVGAVQWVKVGSILFVREGPAFVRSLVDRGLDVFLDLKWHDIPNTVSGAVAQARDLGVRMATVHTLGGREMMAGAAKTAGPDLRIVGVTVLTSHTPASFGEATGRTSPDLTADAIRLSRNALEAGISGVVCSPLEAQAVRTVLGVGPLVVVPGIRRPGDAAGDQSRTATAQEAAAAGASHLVVGRPVLQAEDPAAVWAELSYGLE
jgi:orotidine-5'-phosphate decarboxylase